MPETAARQRAVLLLHAPPASFPYPHPHADLMLQPPDSSEDPDARELLTFRLPPDPEIHLPNCPATLDATRIVDHRNEYLSIRSLECERRGSMRRVAEATLAWISHAEDDLEFDISWTQGQTNRWRASRLPGAPDFPSIFRFTQRSR